MSERARDSLRGRWDTLSNKRQGGRKLRQPWTKKEDDALASEVLEHGTNWKDILENNRTFQAKYGHMKGECQGINTKRRIQYATHPTLFPFSLSLFWILFFSGEGKGCTEGSMANSAPKL